MCLFCYAKNVLLLWNIHLSNSHRLLLLFSFCAKQCRNEYSFSLQWKLLTPLWILPRHYTSQHLKSRASKISGPFGMHSSLFHLNHLAFQCSNSPCQVSTCCLHHWQHYSSEQGHSCAQKDFISFPWNQGYPCCRRLLLQWLSSRKVPRGGGGLPSKHSQLELLQVPKMTLPLLAHCADKSCPPGTKEQAQPQRKSDSEEGPAMTRFSPTSLSIFLLPRTGSWN